MRGVDTTVRVKLTAEADYTEVQRVNRATLEHRRGTVDVTKLGRSFRSRIHGLGQWSVLLESQYDQDDAGQEIIRDAFSSRDALDLQWDTGEPDEWSSEIAASEDYEVGEDATAVGDTSDDAIALINLLFGLSEMGDDARFYGEVKVQAHRKRGSADGTVTASFRLEGNGALNVV